MRTLGYYKFIRYRNVRLRSAMECRQGARPGDGGEGGGTRDLWPSMLCARMLAFWFLRGNVLSSL